MHGAHTRRSDDRVAAAGWVIRFTGLPTRRGPSWRMGPPVSVTYVIDRDGTIIYAYADVDYRDRADPREVLQVLTNRAAAE